MDIDPKTMPVRDRYKLMIGSILPRPIAWVSSISPDGITNLAPFSFFTGITAEPMSICFAPVNNRDGKFKDTLVNIRATKQFVVNLSTEGNAGKMNQTSAPSPYGVSIQISLYFGLTERMLFRSRILKSSTSISFSDLALSKSGDSR